MNYQEWNTCLRDYFFNPSAAGREVILFADATLISKIGERSGADFNDFITAIKKGPHWSNKTYLCQKAYDIYYNWRSNWGKPQYVAYLVFFVLAAGTEGEFSSHAYYPRLNQLLGNPADIGAPASFRRMYELWQDLEVWSRTDMVETLGRFSARIRGSWVHVGFPLSQTLITADERAALPRIFAEYGFDPTCPPNLSVLSKAICNHSELQMRTRRLLQSEERDTADLRDALIDLIAADLKDWSGDVGAENEGLSAEGFRIFGSARLCIEYNSVSQSVKSSIRFKVNRDLPEEEMFFIRERDQSTWACRGSIHSWSTEFYDPGTKGILDAGYLNWTEGELFSDETGNWRVRLCGREVRLFVNGMREKLPRFIETNTIQTNTKYFVACSNNYVQEIAEWGPKSCQVFRENHVINGLPIGWRLFEIENVIQSHSRIDVLRLPISISMNFVGGVKSDRGNKYFDFAPPKIAIEGCPVDVTPMTLGCALSLGNDGLWELPSDLPVSQPIPIEVSIADRTVRATMQLEESGIRDKYEPLMRDHFGKPMEISNSYCTITAANVSGEILRNIPLYNAEFPTYLSHRIIFLGSNPGEIVFWPGEGLPSGWDPVWAITKIRRDKWQAHYVGHLDDIANIKFSDRKITYDWKKWRKIFTFYDVVPPGLKTLAKMWNNYKKEARRL
ncbi:MAG: hypothetical protein LLG02_04935 [Pelosinus sp.]|nr:hypothetical protein [Pelosinus sp.]